MKVLFHIDAEEKWTLVLENVKNMLSYGKESGECFEIEVLANGRAAIELLESAAVEAGLAETMQTLTEQGVSFFACNNSLNKFADGRKLGAFAGVVPAGVVELVKKQEEGFAYIKP